MLAHNIISLYSFSVSKCKIRMHIDVLMHIVILLHSHSKNQICGHMSSNFQLPNSYYVLEQSILYNYADDNIVPHTNDEEEEFLTFLESDLSNLMSWFKTNCLGVNRGKLQCMFIGNDSHNTINVNIDNTVLSPSINLKILVVTIDERLTFNKHINIICSNSARQLNAIKRLQCNLDKESKVAIYRSYILSNFNYCPLVWHFCGIQNSRNMETIQERALRFVYEDYESTYDILIKRETMICYI